MGEGVGVGRLRGWVGEEVLVGWVSLAQIC